MFRNGTVVTVTRDVKDYSGWMPKTVALEGMTGVVIKEPGFFDVLSGKHVVRFDGGRVVTVPQADLRKAEVPALR